jgi:hypothetical protein
MGTEVHLYIDETCRLDPQDLLDMQTGLTTGFVEHRGDNFLRSPHYVTKYNPISWPDSISRPQCYLAETIPTRRNVCYPLPWQRSVFSTEVRP